MDRPLKYVQRIKAQNFAPSHDDGMKLSDMANADIVLTGVPRSGKCGYKVRRAESIFRAAQLPCLDAASISIEEIATTILEYLKLRAQVSGSSLPTIR